MYQKSKTQTSSFKKIEKLKTKNVIYQFLGILVLVSIFFLKFKYFLLFNIIGISILSMITLSILKLSRKIILITYFEDEKKILMTTYSKKEVSYELDNLCITINGNGFIIQDEKGNLLIHINKNEWDNFVLLKTLFQDKQCEKKINKSTFKGLIKEIIVSELKDPSSFY